MTLRKFFKCIGMGLLFLGILFVAFWIRIQGGKRLYVEIGDGRIGRFTENDAYLYHYQAGVIVEAGGLPGRDRHRWLPMGRDNEQLFPVYAYAIAYTHKALPGVSLYHIQLYAPAFCFTIGLCGLLLFLTRCWGATFAAIVGLLVATLPGSVERSAIGFGDRDAWCWMLGVLAVTTYLWKEQLSSPHSPRPTDKVRLKQGRRYLATVLSGSLVFLGGMSWEGFGSFLLIILAVELWKFCTTSAEYNLKEYLLWILVFVPGLYLMSPAYRSGYGFSTHVAALMFFPVLLVYAMRGTRYLLLRYVTRLRLHARKLAVGLTLLGGAAGVCYIFLQSGTFETTAFAFQESRLMQHVGELVDPHFRYWHRRYGATFILGSLGLITMCLTMWRHNGIPLMFSLTLFTTTTFFRDPIAAWIGADLCNILFLISLALTGLWFGIAILRETPAPNETVAIAILVWFLLWVGLARGGRRYDFFIGLPLAYGTAWLLWQSPKYLTQKLKDAKILYPHIKEHWIAAVAIIIVLIPVSFWPGLGGHATRSVYAASEMRAPVPNTRSMMRTFKWIEQRLPKNAVIAADWSYGTQLNVLSGIKTITDSDHFLPHWIHLYYRHGFCAPNKEEALTFFKTHGATHFMLTKRDVTSRAEKYSFVGSNTENDRHFRIYELVQREVPIGGPHQLRPKEEETPLEFVDLVSVTPGRSPGAHIRRTSGARQRIAVTVHLKTHRNISQEISINPHRPSQCAIDIGDGGIVLYFKYNGILDEAYYLPPLGWNSLAVKLFLRHQHVEGFVLVYPQNVEIAADVKVWEIRYPPGIKKDSKYLTTEPDTSHEESRR